MPVISIDGSSGIGKSFLVKQLACLDCAPAFFEGEEGTIPNEIFESIFTKENPVRRFKWFIERYKKRLERARKISSELGINCYVEGSTMTAKAVLAHEDKKHYDELKKIAYSIDYLEPDKIIVLITNRGKYMEFFKVRGRITEQHKEAIDRTLHLQDEFIRLAKKKKNTIIIDRTDLDFTREKDLKFVMDKIKKKQPL